MSTGVSIPLSCFTKEQQQELLKLEKGKPIDDRHEQFYALSEERLRHAREKHPEFVKVVSQFLPEEHIGKLEHFRQTNELRRHNAPSLYNVLREEVEEFILEMLRGDKTRAREEAADIVSVVFRALDGDHLKTSSN